MAQAYWTFAGSAEEVVRLTQQAHVNGYQTEVKAVPSGDGDWTYEIFCVKKDDTGRDT